MRGWRLFDEFLDQAAKLGWGSTTRNNLVIANTSAAQRLFLDRIASSRSALVMGPALIFDGFTRLTVLVHQKQVHSF